MQGLYKRNEAAGFTYYTKQAPISVTDVKESPTSMFCERKKCLITTSKNR